MKPKNQRLVLVAAALAALVIAVMLAMWGLRDRASYFLTPTDIATGKAESGRAVRLGGMIALMQENPKASWRPVAGATLLELVANSERGRPAKKR